MKTCRKCKLEKPLSDFYPHRRSTDGRHYYCMECSRALANAYAARHMGKIVEKAKGWYLANKDRKRAYDAKRRKEKRSLYREASRRFREKHPGRKNADTQARRAQFALRLPRWQRSSELTVFYECAARVSQCLGILHCVDHVIPLRGKTVSGLHVPGNLAVVPERFNLSKSNHFSISPDGVRA